MSESIQEPRDPKLPELRGTAPGDRAQTRVLRAPLPYNDVITAP